MRLRPALLIVFLFSIDIFTAKISAQTRNNIAVSDLVGQSVDQASAAIISDRLRTELFNTGTFKVLERQSMQDILKEQGFQQTGCTSDQCMVDIGQLLGVSHIVTGTVGKLGEMFTINVRFIDVKTGEIVYTTNVDCRCPVEDLLTKSVPSIAGKIALSVRKPDSTTIKASPVAQASATGSLRIQTDPLGARIFLDKADMGLTPFTKDSVSNGNHSISIHLDGYVGLETNLSVSSGEIVHKEFILSHTKAWKDSVKSALRATEAAKNAGKPQKKHSIVPKVVFGVLAVGSGVAGVGFNYLEQAKINNAGTLKQQYINSGYSNTSYYQSQLGSNATAVRNYDTMRNVSYIVACLCAVGFAISFAF